MNLTPLSLPPLSDGERLDEVNEQIRLIQKKKGLTFGTDAFLLAAYIRRSPNSIAVELGGGTGIISLLLAARNKIKQVTVAEIQQPYAELIERNAILNGYDDKVKSLCMDVRSLTPSVIGREVDLVYSNPPYMKCNTGKRNTEDEKYIARHEVCGGIEDFCLAAGRLLRHGGRFVCVWRPDRLSELFSALGSAKLEPKRMTFVHADAQAEPCMVLVESVKVGSPSMRISAPLLLYRAQDDGQSKRILTPEAQKIYDDCCFPSETNASGDNIHIKTSQIQ